MKKLLTITAVILTYLTLGNGCAYLDKWVDARVRGISKEQSALESLMNYNPVANGIGYNTGHERFYGEPLAQTITEIKN